MKKLFNVSVSVTVGKLYTIEAENEEEAIAMARSMCEYDDLNHFDFVDDNYDAWEK